MTTLTFLYYDKITKSESYMHRITFYMLTYVTVIPHPFQTGDTEMILHFTAVMLCPVFLAF